MKVKELIEKLQAFDPELDVLFWDCEWEWSVPEEPELVSLKVGDYSAFMHQDKPTTFVGI